MPIFSKLLKNKKFSTWRKDFKTKKEIEKMRKIANKLSTMKAKAETYIACKQCGVKMENGDHLVEVLGTIIIAVVLLIFFRQEISDMFNNMMNQTENKVNNLFQNVVNG
jgi:hypothetical protein